MVSLNAPFRRRPGVELTDLTDAMILTSPAVGTMFGVNTVGRRIIQLLDRPQTFDALVSELMRDFRVEPAQCEAEVREFLTELDARELIENC
jgi:coenzyme PQQ synthesis protein D (PqqD)